MAIYSYHDLEVYREAFRLALKVHEIVKGFPASERFSLADQMKRSSRSICALIAEGFAQKEKKFEFRRYLRMAHGSVQETKVWIEFSEALGFIASLEAKDLWDSYDRLGKRLFRISRQWK